MTLHSEYYLVLIETASNQRFIYDTNKLRDNIGASELIHRSTTDWVKAATEELGLAEAVERVVSLSGKTVLLVPGRDEARRIIHAVTRRALDEAPGLALRGVAGREPIDLDTTKSCDFHRALTALFAEHERLGSVLPPPEARLQRLPVVAPCVRSGLPASRIVHPPGGSAELLSEQSYAKQDAARAGWKRITKSLRKIDPSLTFYKNISEMEKANQSMDWAGLIHADGNGLGRIFLSFVDAYVEPNEPARAYINRYRSFSQALDDCTCRAFAGALAAWRAEAGRDASKPLPVVPLVLGGDDLTVLCDGATAVRLAADYLTRFMDATAADEDVQAVLRGKPLGVCAGVALVKPHYPHHAAYDLACDLLDKAKAGKMVFQKDGAVLPFAGLDVHVHLDSSGHALDPVRGRQRSGDGRARLTARPFVVRAPDGADLDDRARAWMANRGWEWHERVMPFMPRGGGGLDAEQRLPNSVLHGLRDAAIDGVEVADARLRAVLGREMKDAPHRVATAWAALLGTTDPETASLFVPLPDKPDDEAQATRLFDALDLMDFWR